MVITLTINHHLAEDLRTLLQFSTSLEIYEEKIGSQEVILSIRTRTDQEFEAVRQVLKKAGTVEFNLDDEAA